MSTRAQSAVAVTPPPSGHAWWALAVFSIFNLISIVDRSVLSILIVDIKAELGLSDLAISLIHGGSFAIFYSLVGVFMGGLIDRYPRRPLIFAGVSIWSVAASATAFASNFATMLGARVAVAVGEATLSPGALSMLSQLFPRARLSSVISIYVASGTLGAGLSVALGGWALDALTAHPFPGVLGTLAPWRQVLLLTGAPGLILAFIIFTVKEPRRDAPQNCSAPEAHGLREQFRGRAGAFIGLLSVFGLCSMLSYAVMMWGPTYGRRVVGMSAAEVGAISGAVIGIGGILSAIAMGMVVDRLNRRGRADAALNCYLVAAVISVPIGMLGFLVNSEPLYITALVAIQFGLGATFGMQMALLQIISPPLARGRVAAMSTLVSNVVGLGLGPVAVGMMTDFVFGSPDQIGRSIAVVIAFAGVCSATILWFARPAVRAALAAASNSDISQTQ